MIVELIFEVLAHLLYDLGGLVVWTLKGRKSSLSAEIANHPVRNLAITTLLVAGVVLFFLKLL